MSAKYQSFHHTVWQYYRQHGRHDLPWRQLEIDGGFDPYKIMVSEVMLQQTQVARVVDKYRDFLAQFPTSACLAAAELGAVLRAWSGLGYNRRAKFLHQAAQAIEAEHAGIFPDTIPGLVKLPGIGPNTAAAIAVYAFNQPAVFVETNIRTVFIYHFFRERQAVSDREILALVDKTLDVVEPRMWYWALMDYGSYLKQTTGGLNSVSKHYAKQSAFKGSRREIRGLILKALSGKPLTLNMLSKFIPDARLAAVLDDLIKEELVIRRGQRLSL